MQILIQLNMYFTGNNYFQRTNTKKIAYSIYLNFLNFFVLLFDLYNILSIFLILIDSIFLFNT